MDPRLMRMAEDGELPRPQTPHMPTKSDCRYALERTDSFIKVWFWGRGSGSTPDEVANGAGSIDTDNWVRGIFFSWRCQLTLSQKGDPRCVLPEHTM